MVRNPVNAGKGGLRADGVAGTAGNGEAAAGGDSRTEVTPESDART